MDWLERFFGLNPDQGDGSVESLIVVAILCAAAAAVAIVALRRAKSSPSRPAKQIRTS